MPLGRKYKRSCKDIRKDSRKRPKITSFEQNLQGTIDEVTRRESLRKSAECDSEASHHVSATLDPSDLAPVSEDQQMQLSRRFRDSLCSNWYGRLPCAVCDEDNWRKDCKVMKMSELSDSFLSKMQKKLEPPLDLEQEIVDFYDQSYMHPALKGIMLGKNGVNLTGEDEVSVSICLSCDKSLRSRVNAPPRFSIRNGFYCAQLPHSLPSATSVEWNLVSTVTLSLKTVLLRGGAYRQLRSHSIIFDANPTAAEEILPRSLGHPDTIRLLFTGSLTEAQRNLAKKWHTARQSVVRSLLDFLKQHNFLYGDVAVRQDRLNAIPSTEDGDVPQELLVHADVNTENVDYDMSGVSRPPNTAEGDDEVAICADGRLFMRLTTQSEVLSFEIQRSTGLIRDRSDYVIERLFPHLFPYGRGGPQEVRPNSVSFDECLKHYLRLSSRQFAKDAYYPLVSFDMQARAKVMERISMALRNDHAQVNQIVRVSKDMYMDLLKSMEREDYNRSTEYTNATEEERCAQVLRKTALYASRSMWGSKEERLVARREAFSMMGSLGAPHVFFTLNLSELDNMTVGYFAGRYGLRSLNDLTSEDIPTNSEKWKIVAENPMAAAMYFHRSVDLFIKVGLGWDSKTQRSLPEGGLFGKTKAFYGSVETQERGALHLHLLVFLEGMPETTAEMECLLESEGWSNRLKAYVDSVCRETLPIKPEDTNCFSDTCNAGPGCYVQADGIKKGFLKRYGVQIEPKAVQCSECGDSLSATEFYNRVLSNDSAEQSLDDETNCLLSMPQVAVDIDNDTDAVQKRKLTLIGRKCMVHDFKHRGSCFKHSTVNRGQKTCRYNFPKDLKPETNLTDDEILEVQRLLANEYTNAYNPVILSAFKCNHDVRVLVGCAPHLVYYIMKYTTKPQMSFGVEGALAYMAFEKRLERERMKDASGDNPLTDYSRAFGRIASVVYGTTSKQEISSALACFYQIHGSITYSSHEFATLSVPHFNAVLANEPHDAVLVPVDSAQSEFSKVRRWDDYTSRPAQLENICLFEFTRIYEKVSAKKQQRPPGEDCEEEPDVDQVDLQPNLRFLVNHPQSLSHVLRRRKRCHIADVVGGRLADTDKVADSEKLREEYARHVLILWKPFRSANELKEENETYWDAFQAWEKPHICQQWLLRQQDYYVGRKSAQANAAKLQMEAAQYVADADGSDDEESGDAQVEPNFSGVNTTSVDEAMFEQLLPVDNSSKRMHEIAAEGERTGLFKRIADGVLAPGNEVRNSYMRGRLFPELNAAPQSIEARRIPDVQHQLQEIKKRFLELGGPMPSTNNFSLLRTFPDRPLRVLIPDAERWTGWYPPGSAEREDAARNKPLSIESVSAIYNLNKEQHAVLKLAGECLLREYRTECPDLNNSDERPQLQLLVLGAAGRGKSMAFESVKHLARECKHPLSVVVTAHTGIAASNVKGPTIYSLLGMTPWGCKDAKCKDNMLIKRLKPVKCIIIDEVSIISTDMLHRIDVRLQELKENRNQRFGGLHIILAGDLFQLPPVCRQPIYRRVAGVVELSLLTQEMQEQPKSKKRRKQQELKKASILGSQLWQSFKDTIMLTECMRQRDDTSFADLLDSVRVGDWTGDIINEINKRLNADLPEDAFYTMTTYFTNDARHACNRKSTEEVAKQLQNGDTGERVIRLRAHIQKTARGQTISPALKQYIYTRGDDKTERLPPVLDLFIGMPVQVSQNVAPELCIANGTYGIIAGIQFPLGTTFTIEEENGIEYAVPSHPPEYIFLDIPSSDGFDMHGLPGSLPNTVIAICPSVQHTIRDVIVPASLSVAGNRTVTFEMTQFPIVPAFACTVYRVQGLTLPNIIIGAFCEFGCNRTPAASAYIALSRVRRIINIKTLQNITQDLAHKFRPPDDLIDEENRLRSMHNDTSERYDLNLSRLDPLAKPQNRQHMCHSNASHLPTANSPEPTFPPPSLPSTFLDGQHLQNETTLFEVVSSPGDGNCLWHSLAYFVDGMDWRAVKDAFIGYLLSDEGNAIFNEMMAASDACKDTANVTNVTEYLQQRRYHSSNHDATVNDYGAWGQEIDIILFATMIQSPVKVVVRRVENGAVSIHSLSHSTPGVQPMLPPPTLPFNPPFARLPPGCVNILNTNEKHFDVLQIVHAVAFNLGLDIENE